MEAVVLGDGSDTFAKVVQLLVEADCNINIPDNQGITALQHARAKGYKQIVEILENVSRDFWTKSSLFLNDLFLFNNI